MLVDIAGAEFPADQECRGAVRGQVADRHVRDRTGIRGPVQLREVAVGSRQDAAQGLDLGLGRGGRRVSTMQGVAVALVLGIAYMMLVALFSKLGEVEVLPPVVGAWAPFILATLFAINRLTGLRT